MAGRSESFFHGTVHDIGVGRHVLPAPAAGKHNKPGSKGYARQRSDRHAYAAEDEATAWDFAAHRAMDSRLQAAEEGHPSPPAQRARVYEVAPHPMMRKGVYHPDHPNNRKDVPSDREWIAPQYKITGVHDIMPGRQGTFPNINWNQFSTAVGTLGDANHPTAEDQEVGHAYTLSPAWRARVDADLEEQIASRTRPKEVRGQLPLFEHSDEKR